MSWKSPCVSSGTVVERLPHLGREKREASEQALDVGILSLGSTRWAVSLAGSAELLREAADVVEFFVVVGGTHVV